MIKHLRMVPILAVGFWLAHPVFAAESEQVDTLVDVDGREIRAVVEKVFNTRVVFRRTSDNEIFDLPLDRLNEATRQRLQEIKRGEGREPVRMTAAAAEWKRLRVVLPNPLDAVAIAGLGNLGQEQRAASSYELWIPEGCWVKVNLKANQEMLEHLVHFDGKANQWTFRSEGPHLFLREDNGPEKVVGVTLEEGTGPEKWFAAASVPFAESLSVELQEAGQVERLGTPPVRISAICATNYELSDDEIASIAKRNLAALAIDLDYRLMPSLSHFEGALLEACSLEFLNEPVEVEGGRAKSYPVDLPSLPRLKYFNNFFTVIPGDYADTLARKTPALRTLTVSASHQKPTPAWFSGLDRLLQLESLNLSWGAKTDVAELLKLSALRSFACDNGGLPVDGADFSDFPKLRGLTVYQNTTGGFPEDLVRQWSEQGGMEQLIRYEGYRFVDFRHLKMLEVAKLRRNEKQHDTLDAGSLGTLDRLWSLRLDRADQSDIDAIGKLPNASRIEALYLYHGDYTDLSPLASLVNLKKLELAENDGGIEVLDLGNFPRLEHVYIGFFPALTAIVNLDSRPDLKYFSLAYCTKLESVGGPFTKTKLAGVRLNAVNRFTDLAFLAGSQLRQLELYRCNGLVEPLGFDLESVEYGLIHDCVKLPEKTPGK